MTAPDDVATETRRQLAALPDITVAPLHCGMTVCMIWRAEQAEPGPWSWLSAEPPAHEETP